MTNGVVRAGSGVRPQAPQVRWDPGARYRPSVLRAQAAPATPQPGDVAATTWSLPGRLFRGPAHRTAVFDRRVWAPGTRGRAGLTAEIADAVGRYRTGALTTTGLRRAVGSALT